MAQGYSELHTRQAICILIWISFPKGEILHRCSLSFCLLDPLGTEPRPWNVKLPWFVEGWIWPRSVDASLRQESKLKGCELCATSVAVDGILRIPSSLDKPFESILVIHTLFRTLHRLSRFDCCKLPILNTRVSWTFMIIYDGPSRQWFPFEGFLKMRLLRSKDFRTRAAKIMVWPSRRCRWVKHGQEKSEQAMPTPGSSLPWPAGIILNPLILDQLCHF